jgi:hypothetical protein
VDAEPPVGVIANIVGVGQPGKPAMITPVFGAPAMKTPVLFRNWSVE